MRRLVLLVALLIFALAPAPPVAAAAEGDDGVRSLIERLLTGDASAATGPRDRTSVALRQFYGSRGFQPVWSGDGAREERAREVAAVLLAAEEEGLRPADYGAARVAALVGATGPRERAELELLMSRSFVAYARDVHAGRVDPTLVDDEHRIVPEEIAPATVLFAVGRSPDPAGLLRDLAPQGAEYRRLRAALAAHREVAADGGWGRVPEGEALRTGTAGPRVEALRRRLTETGDLAAVAAGGGGRPELFDPALEAAVRIFQARHGLDADGVVGPRTLAALNVPVEVRIEQIVLNMERRRWMPEDPGERHVFVNLADFELEVVERGRTAFTSRVVVGAPYHRTPVFSRPMTYLEFNPYWHVPRSIATGELLPEIQRDPAHLMRNRFTVLTADGARPVDPAAVDWAALGPDRFPYRLRQEPGDDNALGRVKFVLPNPYSIYLHDTPAKALFGRTVRAFSHGCIRVERPLELAAVVLGAQGLSRAEVDAAVAHGERRVVTLRRPLPVHVTYLTAWVDEDGTAHFRDDIYGRDARLAAALTS